MIIFSIGGACHSEEAMFCLNGRSCAHHVQQYHCPQSQYTTSILITRACWSRPRLFLCSCRKPFGENTIYPKYQGDWPFPLFQAYVWDWMMVMPDEYRILRRSRFSVPTVAYILSRSVVQHSKLCLLLTFGYSVGTLGLCVSATVFQGDQGCFRAWPTAWTNHLNILNSFSGRWVPNPSIYYGILLCIGLVVNFIAFLLPCTGGLRQFQGYYSLLWPHVGFNSGLVYSHPTLNWK